MRISKQRSGGEQTSGRGEYEVSDNAPNGLTPTDLLNRVIHLRLGEYTINTGVHLTNQGKKRRLRRLSGTSQMVQLQIAAALMMPKPIRDEQRLEAGLPVLQTGRYIITDIQLGNVELTAGNIVTAEAQRVDFANQAYRGQQLSVADRIHKIETIWQRRLQLPHDIAALIEQHQNIVTTGNSISQTATTLVGKLQNRMADYSMDADIDYFPTTDVVDAILAALGEAVETFPVRLEEIEPEQLQLRKREVRKMRMSATRDASSVTFRRKVRNAYKSCCIMCGSRFPATAYNSKPGIDAAHILPYAEYDLDAIYNGVALCKTHHWAFDEGILTIAYNSGTYAVEMPDAALRQLSNPGFSLDVLEQVVGEIPISRLPTSQRDWPRPQLLQQLNDELYPADQ